MPMLPVAASELAQIQADLVAAICDKSCQIYRDLTATTPGLYGSSSSSRSDTSAYTLQHTTVCGMAQPTGGELQNYDYLIGDKAAWTMHFPVGTDVVERDHVVVEGQVLEVHVLLTPQSYQGLLSVITAEIK